MGDLEERFGDAFDAGAVARPPIQVLAGSLDTRPDDASMGPRDGGSDRLARAHVLADARRWA